MAEKKISSFKKFSEMNENDSIQPEDNTGLPLLPNNNTKSSAAQSTRYMKPKAQTEKGNNYTIPESEDKSDMVSNGQMKYDESKVHTIGKVAILPKGTKASKGLNFMENVKIPKSSIWYLMIEKQNFGKDKNELQMIKYNLTKGFDLGKFTNELKSYYIKKYSKNPKIVKLIEAIEIDGDEKFSWIKNIPLVTLDGKKLVSIITEDLIKLLSR